MSFWRSKDIWRGCVYNFVVEYYIKLYNVSACQNNVRNNTDRLVLVQDVERQIYN